MSEEATNQPTGNPSNEMASAVRRIANGSDLYDVRTIATFARLHMDAPEIGTPITAALAISLNGQLADDEFRILGKFGLKAYEEGAQEKPFFSVSLHIVAYYRLRSGEKLTQEELQAFASSNGMIHLWPYFRTFVQQSCGQFSIPSIVLPPFRATHPLKVRFGKEEHEIPKSVVDRLPTESSG